MIYSELTHYEKLRFDKECFCKICKQKIFRYQTFEMTKTKVGKSIKYNFFHRNCIEADCEYIAYKHMQGYYS